MPDQGNSTPQALSLIRNVCEAELVPQVATIEAFLLVRNWRDGADGLTLTLWGSSKSGPVCIRLKQQEAILFVRRTIETTYGERRPVQLRTMDGCAVDALYFRTQRQLVEARNALGRLGHCPLEADVKPVERFLMERFILGSFCATGRQELRDGVLYMDNPKLTQSNFSPQLSSLAIDIETDGFEGALLSLAGATDSLERVFLVGEHPLRNGDSLPSWVSCHQGEGEALDAFLQWVAEVDPDLIVGWNVVEFDLKYLVALCARLKKKLRLGRAGLPAEVLVPHAPGYPHIARVPGRVVLDGIATLRSATIRFESFALADVALQLLGREKRIAHNRDPAAEIRRMAAHDPRALAEYNLEDCRLVLDIFKKANLVEFAMERQCLTGLPMDRQGGSVAAFDQLYLPRLHRAGYVAPSVKERTLGHGSPGGFVMNSQPGLYQNVLVLDFKSLYPSIIRTFRIDPLGLALGTEAGVAGFNGAYFAREGHILPGMIQKMWIARDGAKKRENASLSQAIKIMMNSFYGVLGTPGCRFFDSRLVSSITLRGHEILAQCRQFIESEGFEVIYGDTDSVFVLLGPKKEAAECQAIGASLATSLTSYFRQKLYDSMNIESYLELEFETHFERFLMPTIRGSEVGTKKRYAGSVRDSQGKLKIVFKGLEAVRTDWTPLARGFQRELFRRVFSDESYVPFVKEVVSELRLGHLDGQLVYKKRLRRPLHEYETNVPPHVQAARLLDKATRSIEYVITTAGPQPVSKITHALNYEHYVERQLAPAADSLLRFLETSFANIAGPQMSLFRR